MLNVNYNISRKAMVRCTKFKIAQQRVYRLLFIYKGSRKAILHKVQMTPGTKVV